MAGSSLNLSVTISTDAKRAVEGFAALKRSLAEQESSLKAAREEAARLAAQIKATGQADPKLAQAFEEAKKRAADLKAEVAQGRERLELMRRSLAAGGIDTRNLSQSMQRVAQQTRAAAEQAQALSRMARETQRVNQAREIIGISRDTTEREIRQVQAALQRLKESGRLSGEEMARAMLAAKTRMAELRMESGGLLQSLARIKEQVAVAFAPLAGLGVIAASGGRDFLGFTRKLSEIRTLTRASREEMDEFGRSIRQLAQTMGKDATDMAAAAYNIISAGVSQARALEVLSLSAKAATAGVADVNDTARLGLAVMNSYGGSVDDLASIYDTLFTTVKNGVTTIPELASSLGRVLPTAKEAGVAFDELTAALAQLTQNFGGQTSEAVTALNSAIVQLAAPAPEAAERLKALGIEYRGLIGTIAQIREKNLDIEAIRRIIPDIEGAKAVMSLAGSFDALQEKLKDAASAAGAMQTAFSFVQGDEAASVERLAQSWAEFKRALGETLAVFAPVLDALAGLLRGFNGLNPVIRSVVAISLALLPVWRAIKTVGGLVLTALKAMPGAFAGFNGSALQAITSVKGAFLAFYAAIAGWSIGSYLREEFAVVEKAGVALVAGLLKGWARIEYAWARITGIFKGGDAAKQAKEALERQLAEVDDWATQRFMDIDAKHTGKSVARKLAAPKPTGSNPFANAKQTKTGPAVGREAGTESARLALVKAEAEAEFALLKDSLDRQKRQLDAALEDRLVSIRDYYARKTAIEQQAIDAEIARRQQELAAQRAIAANPKASEDARLRAQGEVKKLEAELIVLNNRRADVAVDNARRAAAAERELGNELARVRERLAEIAGGSGGDVTRARLEREYQPLIEKLQRMGDTAGVADVRRLIDAESAIAELAKLERQYQAVTERMTIRERELQVQKDAGMITESQMRREVLNLHKQTAAEVEGLIPKMQELADSTGSEEAINRVKRLKVEVSGLKTEIDDVATRINGDVENAFVAMFEKIGTGAKTAKEAFLDFARAVVASLQRIAAQKLAEQIFGSFGKGGGIGGFFAGLFRGFAAGGPVPGSGTRDTVPAMLTPGEFVIRRDVARRIGYRMLDAINGGGWLPSVSIGRLAFASGGAVPAVGGTVNNVSVVVHTETGGRVHGDSSSAADLGRRIEAAVRGVLVAEKRPGGLLAGA